MTPSSAKPLFSALSLCLLLFVFIGPGDGGHINQIYNFGDSISDTGNLVVEGTGPLFENIKSIPYGKSIGEATGRCSDGLLMIDYIAHRLNLSSLEPYLKKKNARSHFAQGVNFAVVGATALDNSYFRKKGYISPFTTSSLKVQLKWFKNHIMSQCPLRHKVCTTNFDHSLFVLGEIGGNDYNYAFMLARKSIDEVTTYVPDVVKVIIDAAKELIKYGASQIIIPGNFPIGCVPVYLTMFDTPVPSAYDKKGCLRAFNEFSMAHNMQLQQAINKLREVNPKVSIAYADYYNAYMKLFDHPEDYGFQKDVRLRACCGDGSKYNFNPIRQCSAGSTICEDSTKYLSWDGIHFT